MDISRLKELLEKATRHGSVGVTYRDVLGAAKEAEQEVLRLSEEVERLKQLQRGTEITWEGTHQALKECGAKLESAEAKCERLREALKEAADYIASASDRFDGHDTEGFHAAEVAERKARATLQETGR